MVNRKELMIYCNLKRCFISLLEISIFHQSGTFLQKHINLFEEKEFEKVKNAWYLIHRKKIANNERITNAASVG